MRHPLIGRVGLAAGICGITVLGGISGLSVAAANAAPATPQSQGAAAAPAAQSQDKAQQKPQDEHWAFLQQYCSKCHNAEDWAGGIAFDTMSPQDIPSDAKTWEHAVAKLRGRLMPPPGNPQPPTDRIHGFVAYMEDTLDAAATHQVDAPRVPLHRMNRTEYANAIWELLGFASTPTRYCRRTMRATASTMSPTCCRSPRHSSMRIFPPHGRWRYRRSAIARRSRWACNSP